MLGRAQACSYRVTNQLIGSSRSSPRWSAMMRDGVGVRVGGRWTKRVRVRRGTELDVRF